jgi:hypothetical protein
VAHVECRSEAGVRDPVEVMSAAGYELPKDPPDGTFKRPPWMDGGGVAGSDRHRTVAVHRTRAATRRHRKPLAERGSCR